MSSDRRKRRLYKALIELRELNGNPDFLSSVTSKTPPKQGNAADANLPPAEKVLHDFCRFGETIESVGLLVEKSEKFPDNGLPPVVVIPDNKLSSSSGKKFLDAKIGPKKRKLQGLGTGKNGSFKWTVDDDLTAKKNVSTKDDTEMHIVLVSSPTINPGSINGEVCVATMNSLPTLELARAVPYLNVEFLSSETTQQSLEKRSIKGLTTSRYLLGSNLKGHESYKDFIEAPFLQNSVKEEQLGESISRSTYAGMDIFTSPQTMVPLDAIDENKQIRDPFRPFLSVEGFSVTVNSPQYGMDELGCSVTAELSLILHDRKRLEDIAALVTPGGFAKGDILRITYGYAHPDGALIAPDSAATRFNTLYGHIIDGLRVGELFTVSSADFNIQDNGEVKVDVSMFSIGADQDFSAIDVTESLGDTVNFNTVKKKLKEIQILLAKLGGKNTKIKKLNTPSLLTQNGKLTGKQVSWATYKRIVKYRKRLMKKGTGDKGEKAGLTAVEGLIKEVFNRKTGTLQQAAKNRQALLDSVLEKIRTEPDPFIAPAPKGQLKARIGKSSRVPGYTASQLQDLKNLTVARNISYVSFGKLLAVLVGAAIKKEYQDSVNEIQMIFYGFNASAGGVSDMNIASMPLPYWQVKNVITKEFKKRSAMSLATLMEILNESFIHNEKSPAYGIARLPRSHTKMSSLNLIYGLPKGYPDTDFKTPELRVSARLFPGRMKASSKDADSLILRIEVFDARANTSSVFARLLEASSERGVYYPLKRQTSGYVTAMNHQAASQKQEKMIKDYLRDIKLPDSITKSSSPEVKKAAQSIAKHAKYVSLNRRNVKSIMTSAYNTIVFGGAHTGILDASVSSRKDPNAIELAIARQSTRLSAETSEAEGPDDETVAEVYPVEVDLKTIGCPYFNFGQEFYIDFGTGTNIDNLYIVADISHSVAAGDFTTSVKLIQQEAYPTIVADNATINRTIEKLVESTTTKKKK